MGQRACGVSRWSGIGVRGLLLVALAGLSGNVAASAGALATASFFLPGLGQFINGEPGKGATHLTTWLATGALALHYMEEDDYIEYGDRADTDELTLTTNRTSEYADLANRYHMATMFYSSYDAYRIRRENIGNAGYNTPAPPEGFRELALAPFQLRYFARWTTLVPVAIAASALTSDADNSWVTYTEGSLTRDEAALMVFPAHGAVALGEEAFFRGVLNNSFSNYWGPRWGLAASSVTFGLAHSGEGLSANAAVATAYGAYLGWLHQRNDYRLGENVAVHFWWNVFVSLAALQHDAGERTAMVQWEIPF